MISASTREPHASISCPPQLHEPTPADSMQAKGTAPSQPLGHLSALTHSIKPRQHTCKAAIRQHADWKPPNLKREKHEQALLAVPLVRIVCWSGTVSQIPMVVSSPILANVSHNHQHTLSWRACSSQPTSKLDLQPPPLDDPHPSMPDVTHALQSTRTPLTHQRPRLPRNNG
jgi:hypothetical protein